jgi:hypothetical protein
MENDWQLMSEANTFKISTESLLDEIEALHKEVALYKESGIDDPSQHEHLKNKAEGYKLILLPLMNQATALKEKITKNLNSNYPAHVLPQEEAEKVSSDSNQSVKEDFQIYRE